jgi:hypothetical protein
MIDLRAGVLAITICLLIAWAADVPPEPLPQNAPVCVQMFYNKDHRPIAREWVPCTDLDRYEMA